MNGNIAPAWASTQAGFARLVGCSPGLVRAVEQRIKITPKLAMKVQSATGVSIPWLSEMQDPEKPIPTTTGKALTHEMVIQISNQAQLHPVLTGRTGLMASFISVASAVTDRDPSMPMARRMAVAMAKFVEDALFETLNRGDTSLMDAITKLLSQDSLAAEPDSIAPAMATNSETPAQFACGRGLRVVEARFAPERVPRHPCGGGQKRCGSDNLEVPHKPERRGGGKPGKPSAPESR